MNFIKEYHRPNSLSDALQLLNRPDVSSAVLAGGTAFVAHSLGFDEVIDLQNLSLSGVRVAGGRLVIGAMTRLQELIENENVPELVRHTARAEGPNTIRNQATIGGILAGADKESEFLAALLVYEAEVVIEAMDQTHRRSLPDFLMNPKVDLSGSIITEVSMTTEGKTAWERVARTPADKAIVAVLGRQTHAGEIILGVCGAADVPIVIRGGQLPPLQPPTDFRATSQYRNEMTGLLVERVLNYLA